MRIFLAGHTGMVGGAILRRLAVEGQHEIITATRQECDLTNQCAVRDFMQSQRPDYVIIAAAKVGGILANDTYPADFITENLMIATNLISQAHLAGVQNLLQLGSSCIYPRDAAQPIKEDALLSGPLEPTNLPYAIAKIAAIKLCESFNRQHGRDYRSLMPTNLYGPGDNFHPDNAHVLPALIRRFDEAVQAREDTVVIWGSGTPRREFLHVDDLADAVSFLVSLDAEAYQRATQPMQSHINVGTGHDVSIHALAEKIAQITGFKGEIVPDLSKPDGTPRKRLDVSMLTSLGWQARTSLDDGLRETFASYKAQMEAGVHLRAS